MDQKKTEKDLLKTMGKNIRDHRLLGKGWTQANLAEKTGYSLAYISLLERGRRNPPVLTLQRIAKALGVSVTVLLS